MAEYSSIKDTLEHKQMVTYYQKRFGYTKELHGILVNTVDLFEE